MVTSNFTIYKPKTIITKNCSGNSFGFSSFGDRMLVYRVFLLIVRPAEVDVRFSLTLSNIKKVARSCLRTLKSFRSLPQNLYSVPMVVFSKKPTNITIIRVLKEKHQANTDDYNTSAITHILSYAELKACRELPDPVDGYKLADSSRPVVGSVVRFACNPGCMLYGSSARVCGKDGRWSGTQPYCKSE